MLGIKDEIPRKSHHARFVWDSSGAGGVVVVLRLNGGGGKILKWNWKWVKGVGGGGGIQFLAHGTKGEEIYLLLSVFYPDVDYSIILI